jgi:hypothetical protein
MHGGGVLDSLQMIARCVSTYTSRKEIKEKKRKEKKSQLKDNRV